MKRIFFLLVFFSIAFVVTAQGIYAGSKKTLIGTTYSDSHLIRGLEGWQFREGSLISAVDDPETITVDVFRKGSTCVVLFSVKEDSISDFQIVDLLELKNVLKTQTIKTALCRDNKNDNAELVALIREENKEYSKAIKAWRFNRDKRKIELKPAQQVDCLNEGFGQN